MKIVIKTMLLACISLLIVSGCSNNNQPGESASSETASPSSTMISSESIGESETDAPDKTDKTNTTKSNGLNEKEDQKMLITVGGYNFTVTLEKNSSAEALNRYLANGPVTIAMDDYAGMEKVGGLGTTLPRNDKPTTTTIGDVILYLGDQIAIYYRKNSWNFTKLGHIDNVEHLIEALGTGSVEVTLSIE